MHTSHQDNRANQWWSVTPRASATDSGGEQVMESLPRGRKGQGQNPQAGGKDMSRATGRRHWKGPRKGVIIPQSPVALLEATLLWRLRRRGRGRCYPDYLDLASLSWRV